MNSNVSIRTATPIDAPGVAWVQVHSWHAAYHGILRQSTLDAMTEEGRTERWTDILAGNSSNTLVAVHDDRVVGFISAGPSRDEDTNPESTGEVWALYAHPTMWGQGIGWQLWLAGEEHLRRQGFEEVVLWVIETNKRGRKFYESVGCTLDAGATKTTPLEEGVTSVRYRRELTESMTARP